MYFMVVSCYLPIMQLMMLLPTTADCHPKLAVKNSQTQGYQGKTI